MTDQSYDIAIIGGGIGGYTAAIMLAEQNQKVCIIEKCFLGGTCLNVGCIPTKAYLSIAKKFSTIQKAKIFGIECNELHIDYQKIYNFKENAVQSIRTGLTNLIKTNKIEIIHGKAVFENDQTLLINNGEKISAKKIIIATGSSPKNLPNAPFDHQKIYSSTSILQMQDLPKSLAIIGGGYIGCEFANFYAQLGVKVTIIEALDRIIQTEPETISKALESSFKKKDIDIYTKTICEKIEKNNDSVKLTLNNGKIIESEKLLVAIGRDYNSSELNLEKVNVQIDEKKAIITDEYMKTSNPNIFAVGDINGKYLLAHVASHEGIIAAKNILGHLEKMDYSAIPSAIFTTPEIASVGICYEKAKSICNAGKATFPNLALGKAKAENTTEGFAEIVYDKDSHQLLGAHIIGENASNLIAEMTLALQHQMKLEDIAKTIHTHPTNSEIWHESALMGLLTPLHFPPKMNVL
ncbi:MAG TPA: dihydrolipoyl dehydrogenase [Chlamydiales bacterium]|nr:dihydrolipoyl dehydrogenase [Chlamydiales bacterium]